MAGPHDHPFEETYLFLEGRAEGTFDGETYELGPGDVAFAGVGCVHSFQLGGGPLRWLETQAPQPPARHSYRFRRDWDYLADVLRQDRRSKGMNAGAVVVIGGTSGLGHEIARHYLSRRPRRGASPAGTPTSAATAPPPRMGAGPARWGSGSTSPSRRRSPAQLADVGTGRPPGAVRDRPRAQHVAEYDMAQATRIATLKLVGYIEVVHALQSRLTADASIVLFGGRPGSARTRAPPWSPL